MRAPKLRFLGLLSCLFLIPGFAKEPNSEQLKLYYGLAEGNYLIRDYQGAENSIRQILKLDPTYAPALRLQVRIDLEQGDPEDALKIAEQLIELEPENQSNRLLKALVLGHLGRREDAKSIILEIQKQSPTASSVHQAASRMLGLMQMADSNWQSAAEVFFQLYEAAPEANAEHLSLATEAYIEEAESHLNKNAPQSAIAALDQAIARYANKSGQEAFRERTRLNILKAQIQTSYGQLDAAIRTLEEVVRSNEDLTEARVTLATLYASANRWDDLPELVKPIETDPRFQDILQYFEGRRAFANNRIGTAREIFEATLEALPTKEHALRPNLIYYLGACFEKLGRKDEANARVLEAINSGFRPEQTDEALLITRVCLRTEQYERAVEIAESILLNRETENAELWLQLARAHEARRNTALALSAYNQVIRLSPDSPTPLGLRGSLLRKLGDLDGAITDYTKALRFQPENTGLLFALSLCYFQTTELPQALTYLNQASQLQPDNTDYLTLLALLQFTTGDYHASAQSVAKLDRLAAEEDDTRYYLTALEQLRQNPESTLPSSPQPTRQNIVSYINGARSRAEALNQAGIAETPDLAKAQITSTAFWMAQSEIVRGDLGNARELLQICIENGQIYSPEALCARWQLQNIAAPGSIIHSDDK